MRESKRIGIEWADQSRTASRWCPLSHGKAIDVKWKTCYIRLADGSTARSLLVGSFARVKRETRHMTPVCEPTGCDEGSRNGGRKNAIISWRTECHHPGTTTAETNHLSVLFVRCPSEWSVCDRLNESGA
uniref:Uncharacterized protein n=1 Tax=Anopheles coluzzii TaxID=1518534 RepID=A0A8W7P8R9_ANOCL